MSTKITITDEDLKRSEISAPEENKEKIVFCDLADDKSEEPQKSFPLYWYLVLLVPVVSVLGVIWGCFQRKYKFAYQLPAAIVCILSTLLPLLFFVVGDKSDSNWKNELAQRATSGVVIVEIEDSGWFSTKTGFGTGVVVVKNGDTALVLTNRHVISNSKGRLAKKISVLTASGKELPTEVVALPKNPDIDMALLYVGKARFLKVLGDIGDYESLKTGDEVVAIGHPNGLSFTMTQGIVSALRENMLIQSSASINPGNSGGPLLNSNGRIIGINTFFIRDSQGLNFAFRADYILKKSQWNYYKDITRLLSGISVRK